MYVCMYRVTDRQTLAKIYSIAIKDTANGLQMYLIKLKKKKEK